MVKPSLSKRRQPRLIPVLVLILALAVQGTAGQLWDKVPLFSRFTKAAQAAKAAAASFTAPHAPPSTSSLPPAIAAPVVPFPSDPEDASRPPPPPPPAAPAQPPTQQQQQQAVPPPASKKGNAAEKPSTRTTGRNDTQAGCSCLAEWVAKPGGEKLSGCANPDNDPLGAWCPVDPKLCLGYYSVYRTEKGKLRFYDYCVPVRERTKKGCLCTSDWSLGEGAGAVGKASYRDGCARPHSAIGSRICKVDAATCPPGMEINEFDDCEDKQEPMVLTQTTTWHNCGCVQGWNYRYEDGTTAIFSSCANPDADPLGPWCEVDPAKCDSFATIIKNGNQKMSIDYCKSKFETPEPAGCSTRLKLYDQCGGKSNCTQAGCLNAQWPGACCPAGSECRRQDAFYYQCLPVDADISLKTYSPAAPKKGSAPAPPSDAGSAGSNTAAGSPPGKHKASGSPSSKAASKGASPPPVGEGPEAKAESASSELEVASTREVGPRVWVKLRLGMDYDLLAAHPTRMLTFKTDVAAWLKEVVQDTTYIYGTGVDEVMQGSVIALGYVDFTTGAPTHAVDAALEQLHTNGATNYAESKLPAKWGWLLNLSMGQNKTELLQDNSADVQIHTMNYPPGQGPSGPPPGLKLSMTATIAIAVGSIVAVLSGCCIIFIWRRRKAKKERERERERQVKVVQQRGSGKDSRASGYLHDLDGMTGVDDSISGKTGTIKSHKTSSSTMPKAAPGLRGPFNSGRSAAPSDAGNVLGAMVRPSDTGSSRLWNWLQKVDTPTSVETRPETIQQSATPSSNSTRSRESPRPALLPTPRGNTANPVPLLDLSDPGGAFRVPPPSPRFTERPSGPNASPAEAAAAAVAAAAAAATLTGPQNCTMVSPRTMASPRTMSSPRPAPAGAALLHHSASKSGLQGNTEDRRAMGLPPAMHSPRSGLHAGPQQERSHASTSGPPARAHPLESLASAGSGTVFATPTEFSVDSSEGRGQSSRHHSGRLASNQKYDCNDAEGLEAAGMLPPGVGMGPFLRAAIKSLTGQSMGGSTYASDGGGPDAASGPGGFGTSLQPDISLSRGLCSATGGHGGAGRSMGPVDHTGSRSSQRTTRAVGAGAMAAAVRATAEAAATGQGSDGNAELQGSVFQSLWMHRLVAAAEQGDEPMTYTQHRR